MKALEFNNIYKKYSNEVVALNNFSLTVKERKIFGLIGPNGAGKSTCMNILAGLVRSDSGFVRVFDHEIHNNDNLYKKDIGFVLSRPLYFDKLSAQEFLTFVAAMYLLKKSEIKKRTDELISYFELDDRKNDKISTFSTGMKKKISLAAAIIHRPKILVLDEPFEGLEPQTNKLIREMLKVLTSQKNVTVLISSHNLDTIEKLCDEVGIIHHGQLIFESKVDMLYENYEKMINKTDTNNLEDVFIQIIGEEKKKQLTWLK